ncbi:MBL fold metallo-hydrolase [Kocuria sp. HSID16901]|uniref:MBL fold metallo-hydrolase n=1 Tax=Kocuria sp. HSID16901 TaxID=2419505 RepID=UPI000660144A|nr:MBL fold metallo-hydrolase [Kocuria sp. HSID16901]MCT1368073.1 MBL fold metallo-hydrolase [Rothia sp. p3-SID1597]RUQ20630.1 MBL fold metallo-hydrolase [Kocuria sp. HSID16901]
MSASSNFEAAPHSEVSHTWVRTSQHTAYLTVDNPSSMTLEGTNTYVVGVLGENFPPLGDEEKPRVVVLDPGPDSAEHAQRIVDAVDVDLIVVSHRHKDHTGNVDRLHELTGAHVRAWDKDQCRDALPLQDEEVLNATGVEISVWHAPGHTSDSIALSIFDDGVIMTGDTILGRGTTMLDYPDGDLEDYLDTLRVFKEEPGFTVLPAHGPHGEFLEEACDRLLEHRLTRIHDLRLRLKAANDDLGPSATALTDDIYAHVPDQVRGPALKTLKAQLAYLMDIGEIAGFTD